MFENLIAGSVFNEIAAILALAAAVGFIGLLLRQPLIVSFIAVGVIAGPVALDIVRSGEAIHLLSELGVALLLFLVGIKLDVKLVRSIGPVALATGLGQVVFTSVVGFVICLAMGMTPVASVYVAVALTFSSTIIIVKLLSDKREIDSLYGRIALGFLIVQDIVVVLAMIVLSAVGVGAQSDAGALDVLRVLGAGVFMLALVLVFVRVLATPLTEQLARSPELLIGFAIALAASFAALGQGLGFGKELGGLLAGVSLASTPFRDAIAARLAPLRDFLLLFFFVALGSRLNFAGLEQEGLNAAILSAFVLIGNPLIVLVIMTTLGYRRRTGFLAGLTVAQISEFSLIFMAMGVSLGHVGEDTLGLVTLVGLITIAMSTYMITYSHQLYDFLSPALRLFKAEAGKESLNLKETTVEPYDIIIFGLGRYGAALGRRLIRRGARVLGVDFSPEAVTRWKFDGHAAAYGDAADPEFLNSLPLLSVRWAVSTIRQHGALDHADTNLVLIQTLRNQGLRAKSPSPPTGRPSAKH